MHRRVAAWWAGVLLAGLAGLTGCASPPPVRVVKPDGPSAIVEDTAVGGGAGGGTFFFLAELDGVEVSDNSLRSSRQASYGRGPNLQLRTVGRFVPAGRHRLKLAARFDYAAPIQHLFQSGGFGPLDAALETDLVDGGRYRVTGLMDAYRRELWLEDVTTGQVVGQKTSALADDEASRQAMQGASYTCCNLRYDGDWISDANWALLPMIPAGARIKVVDSAREKAKVLIDGRPFRLGLDYGREKETMLQFVQRLSVEQDPRPAIASWPAAVQAAVAAGQVSVGMTKLQVVASLGPPRRDVTADLDAPKWTYWTINEDEYVLEWGADGRLQRVVASPAVLKDVQRGP